MAVRAVACQLEWSQRPFFLIAVLYLLSAGLSFLSRYSVILAVVPALFSVEAACVRDVPDGDCVPTCLAMSRFLCIIAPTFWSRTLGQYSK